MTTRKEDKLRPYRVDYFDIDQMKENDLALLRSIIVRAVTAEEAMSSVLLQHYVSVDGAIPTSGVPSSFGRIVIRAYRYYKSLFHKKDVYKPIEDLFTANKAVKVMEAVEAYRRSKVAPELNGLGPFPLPTWTPAGLGPLPAPVMQPGEHVTRTSDSSLYDEVCVNCGATDTSGKLNLPCTGAHAPTWSGGLQVPISDLTPEAAVTQAAAELGVEPSHLAEHVIAAAESLSGPLSPATIAAVEDLKGMISHDQHEKLMDTFVPYSVPEGKTLPDPTNTAPVDLTVEEYKKLDPFWQSTMSGEFAGRLADPLIEPDKAVGPAGRPPVQVERVKETPLWAKVTTFTVVLLSILSIIKFFLSH